MTTKKTPTIPLPKDWHRHVRSAILHVISLAQFATVYARSWAADSMNGPQSVNGLDGDPFVAAVVDGGVQPLPEPSTLFLCVVAVGLVGRWRKWAG